MILPKQYNEISSSQDQFEQTNINNNSIIMDNYIARIAKDFCRSFERIKQIYERK